MSILKIVVTNDDGSSQEFVPSVPAPAPASTETATPADATAQPAA